MTNSKRAEVEVVPSLLELSGIHLIETGYAPRNVAMLVGRCDTRIHYGGWRSEPLFLPDKELVGKVDFNKGEFTQIKGSVITEIWADESTMAKLKEFLGKAKS